MKHEKTLQNRGRNLLLQNSTLKDNLGATLAFATLAPRTLMNTDIIPPDHPWDLFAKWFDDAKQGESEYPNAMTLATLGSDGMPSARLVLMKDFDAEGLSFYTNRESRKGRELGAHPKAGICFYWKSIQRQIRIEGDVIRLSDPESDAYFATRPRASQIGAWASKQSQALENREMLEARVHDVEQEYQGRDVLRPPHWGGYKLIPSYFEFWQERLHRLHDRIAYSKADNNWVIERLFP